MEADIAKTLLAWLKTTTVGLPLEMIQAQVRALTATEEKKAWRACIVEYNKKRQKQWDWSRTWLLSHMHKWGFSWRAGTTAARKLPPNVEEQHDLFVMRLAYETRRDLPEGCTMLVDGKEVPVDMIPRCCTGNSDQGGIPVVSYHAATWAPTGAKAVPLVDNDNDKRQVTAVLSSSAEGDMMPLQIVMEGKTDKCVVCDCSLSLAACMMIGDLHNHHNPCLTDPTEPTLSPHAPTPTQVAPRCLRPEGG